VFDTCPWILSSNRPVRKKAREMREEGFRETTDDHIIKKEKRATVTQKMRGDETTGFRSSFSRATSARSRDDSGEMMKKKLTIFYIKKGTIRVNKKKQGFAQLISAPLAAQQLLHGESPKAFHC